MCPSSTPALRRTARWRSPPRAHGRTYSKPRVWVARARRVSVRQRVQSVSVLMTVTRLDTVCCAAPAAALRPREEEARPSFSTCEGGPWVESQTAAVLGRGSWQGWRGGGFRAHVCVPACARACALVHMTLSEMTAVEGALSDPHFVRLATVTHGGAGEAGVPRAPWE